ncbi:Protein CBR-ATG-10 [Caenorhabditis briggsae]|uniref:Protein CBR-ATG-10 n=1 Tax=Caenorhabditis briggsae TaxID=6238 RepID=A8WNQ5_CAEBR|nr:Protein CBR-ATG-10 [Caenorhabditis briggsae]CAP22110.2 Protein CBR-ATG-10 [Caenorhabditis briggsae]
MLSEQKFREELQKFVEQMSQNKWNWQLKEVKIRIMIFSAKFKFQNGKYARETHLETLSSGKIVSADIHILYNSTYQVPTLWFNFFENSERFSSKVGEASKIDIFVADGAPIPFEEVVRDILKIPESEESDSSLRQRISHYEHPILGVLYYNIHPCNTEKIMKELKTDSYLISWLSVYGQQLGLRLPDSLKVH